MNGRYRRQSVIGRWGPVLFYAIAVLGWFAEGLVAGAGPRLALIAWTLPVPAIYLWRTRRRKT